MISNRNSSMNKHNKSAPKCNKLSRSKSWRTWWPNRDNWSSSSKTIKIGLLSTRGSKAYWTKTSTAWSKMPTSLHKIRGSSMTHSTIKILRIAKIWFAKSNNKKRSWPRNWKPRKLDLRLLRRRFRSLSLCSEPMARWATLRLTSTTRTWCSWEKKLPGSVPVLIRPNLLPKGSSLTLSRSKTRLWDPATISSPQRISNSWETSSMHYSVRTSRTCLE